MPAVHCLQCYKPTQHDAVRAGPAEAVLGGKAWLVILAESAPVEAGEEGYAEG